MFLIELHKTTNKYLNITLTYCEKILHQNMCRQCPIQDKVIFNGNLSINQMPMYLVYFVHKNSLQKD